ncbi:hypothetical protein [Iningainema tapete]|uniref:Uncharacterized protein n=1 Tax=Iningainema tapete BLCC-T55 TaxID=2748662 RepID=A0A8J6XSY7_9CYAN|nr:hypothetical protein [Iningainema tapete]MBD2778631.1 hypothetical protein [Iningainema tapete BLCC-T55]
MEKVRSYISNHHRNAEPFYIEALEIAELCLGVNHPDTIAIGKNLQSKRFGG